MSLRDEIQVGDRVQIIDQRTMFQDYVGTVTSIDDKAGRITVDLVIFDRPTPVELDLDQIDQLLSIVPSRTEPPRNTQIREFRESDRVALREIYRLCRQAFPWLDAESLADDDFDRDSQDEKILVAIRQSRPVGFISVWEPDNFVHLMFVQPALTRTGIGRALMTACLQHMGRPASLKCVSQNMAARDFYLAGGWRVIAEEEGPEGDYLLMQYD